MNTLEVSRTTLGVAFVGVVLSLLMSGWALVESSDNDQDRQAIEQRLQCLELPGPNDCGADGR
ncbi:MAG: hypothetical protein L0H84_02450 [Pseudonocardia sp.]|nr:hypothetical protein [Pseudonocardia sp.]